MSDTAFFFIGCVVGGALVLTWHWYVFAKYDEWIVANGGTLPPPEVE